MCRPATFLVRAGWTPCCLLVGLSLLCVLGGCSGSHELETAPVKGTVTVDGKPLAGGGLVFVPGHGRGATGTIAPDGTYVMSTYDNADGAIVGRHRVAVFPLTDHSNFEDLSARPPTVPTRYQNIASSGIEVEVKPDEENVFDIKLLSKQ